MARVDILGVPVDALTRRDVLTRCAAWLRGDGLHQIVTVNPELVLAARTSGAVLRVVQRGGLAVPDGVGVLWAARRAGTPLPERIPGVELVEDLCRIAAGQGATVFLLGGREGVSARAASALRRTVPGLKISAFAPAHRSDNPPPELWQELERLRPALLFVAYGQPTQEQWIAAHRERLAAAGVRIAAGVGGAFDILAGTLPRAPRFVRAAGLEWLWRLLLEPRRIPRIFRAIVVFPLAVIVERKRQ